MPQTMETLRALRTIHGNFTDKPISEEDLQKVLETSVLAANASNRQSYSIVVVDDADTQEKLSGYKGSVTLVFCVDYNRIIDVAKHLGHEYAMQGFRLFVTGLVDTCLAAQTAAVAAKSLGIDSLFTNGIHRGDPERIYQLLDLPKMHCFPAIALVLGYAEAEPDHKRGRLSGPGVIHRGTYHCLSDEEMVDIVAQYDDSSEHLDMGIPWSEQGHAHFLDWFYEVWSNRFPSQQGRSQLFDRFINAGLAEGELAD
ncbi:nitroreductase family protein [Candidatus Bipolaricaulota bacterium]